MALFGGQKTEDVTALISKKNYTKAIEVIRDQLNTKKNDPRVRMQLGDVLVLAGKGGQAISIYLSLADEFAKEGFAAKAISVLKKIQRIDPARREVDTRLASLIQEKQRQATVSLPPSAPAFELGMEEIGMEAASGAASGSAEMGMELGMEAPAFGTPEPPPPPPRPSPPPAAARRPAPPAPPPSKPAPVIDQDLFIEGENEEALPTLEPEPEAPTPVEAEPLSLEPEPEPEVLALESEPLQLEPEPEPQAAEPEIVLEPEAEPELLPEPEPEVEAEPVADPMSDAAFADELLSVIENAFPGEGGEVPFAQDIGDVSDASGGGAQIVVSPLFKDFSVDEMVAVIQGLNLITFDAGAIIITQGDPGDSLYMLTSGQVKCFRKNAQGRQALLGVLDEGAFFGEVSILTGKPRTATVVASTYCELLELDRPTLDGITQKHPHVRQVLQQFCDERTKKKA